MEDTDHCDSCCFCPHRNKTLPSQICNVKIGYGFWYEKYAAVEGEWLCLVKAILL